MKEACHKITSLEAKMYCKTIFLIIFCIFFAVSCAERKIYIPKESPEGKLPKQEEALKQEKPESFRKEEGTPAYVSKEDLIKRLQEEVKDIHFDFDKYEIRQEDVPTLKKVASVLQKNPILRVIIEGHCDERGTNEYNFALGQKRANAAKQYLIILGIPSSKIDIISYGEEKPLCTEQNEACWQKNRRAHFVFIEEGR